MKRIVLTGAESTGKSTLAKALVAHYAAPCSGEFVRQYVDELQRELTVDDLGPIARGQFGLEDQAASEATDIVFHDTNILSSIIYAKHYFDVSLDSADDAFAKRDYTLYLLCMPDIPWVADEGQRESPEARDALQAIFKAKLEELNLPYVEIGGTAEERITKVIKAIEQA